MEVEILQEAIDKSRAKKPTFFEQSLKRKRRAEQPHLTWSSAMFRKGEEADGQQAPDEIVTKLGQIEVLTGQGKL